VRIDEYLQVVWNAMNKPKPIGRKAGYFIAIVVNALLILVFNNLLNWGVPFVTDSFRVCLWPINLSLAATLIANGAFLVYDPSWFRHLAQLTLNIIAFAALMTIYVIFPLDFNGANLEPVARLVLVVAMVGTAIGFVVELVKLILRRD